MASSRSSYDDRLPKSRTDRTYFPYINKKSSAFLLEALPERLIKKKIIAIFLEYDSINSLTFPNETDERGAVLLLRITYSALQSSPWSPSIPFQSVILIPLLPHSHLLTTFRLSLN